MKTQNESMINRLIQLTEENKRAGSEFLLLSDQELNWKANSESWSILECLEHLNRYGDFYLPEIQRVIQQAKPTSNTNFKSGVLGSYFAKSMLPKTNLNKMKTFKSMNPCGSQLNRSVVETFISQQNQLITLLNNALQVDLTKEKTAISITKLIRFRLGDTFQFVINHTLRHVVQAQNVRTQVTQ